MDDAAFNLLDDKISMYTTIRQLDPSVNMIPTEVLFSDSEAEMLLKDKQKTDKFWLKLSSGCCGVMCHSGTPEELLTWLHRKQRKLCDQRSWVLQPCVLDKFASVKGRLEEIRVILEVSVSRLARILWCNSGMHNAACVQALRILQSFIDSRPDIPVSTSFRIGFDFLESLQNTSITLIEINVHGKNPHGCPCQGRVSKKTRRARVSAYSS